MIGNYSFKSLDFNYLHLRLNCIDYLTRNYKKILDYSLLFFYLKYKKYERLIKAHL